MSWWSNDDKDKKDRSHQDNNPSSQLDGERWDNGSYQYCET